MAKRVVVVPYNEQWKTDFETINQHLLPAIKDVIISIEHIGSTSVEGLSAKPIIDIDIVIKDYSVFDTVVERLATLGYIHEGNLGIKDREAFDYKGNADLPKHHLYVCPEFSEELHKHITFRDYLRNNPEAVLKYSKVKEEGAGLFPDSIDDYIAYKSPCIEEIYKKCGVKFMKTNGLNWTFDTVAETYEKLRPGYVSELYQTIFEYKPINNLSRVVEIGIGGGQATLPFLKTGCELVAIDYGKNFCELCREKFKEYSNFSAVSGKFEDIDMGGEYDLIYSASAFHWIPEEIGYKKVYDMLKEGGVFARFANHPYRDKGKPELSAEMDQIYADYYYKYHNKEQEPLVEYSKKQAENRALIAEKYGFRDIQYKLFYRTRTFSAKEYVMLLGTYSDHIAIEEKIRTEFFSKIEDAINRHGGEIKIYDTIDLQLARK